MEPGGSMPHSQGLSKVSSKFNVYKLLVFGLDQLLAVPITSIYFYSITFY